ncbi:hypothetical protein AB0B88_15940 [Micromonospora haikouensis]|uniref:hypothetical protein n=1 Tax=Micromonospora haikouensis TaxID=686309 RepID=UPI0033E55E29
MTARTRRAPDPDRPWSVGLADDARASIGRLRTAWDWLGEALQPTPQGPRADRPRRPLDDDATTARLRAHLADRRARHESLRRRITPARPRPAPVNLNVVAARARTVDTLTALHHQVTAHVHGTPVPVRYVDPADRHAALTIACGWCAGTGITQRPDDWSDDWPWPEIPPTCPACHRGRVGNPHATPCAACTARGPCHCDHTTLHVAATLNGIADRLNHLDVERLADVDATLRGLADHTERAAGAGRDIRRLPGNPPPECPACGSRELHAEVGSPDRREWSIRCAGPDCECDGLGCPCLMGTHRRAGRRHVWPSKTWDGPRGLAVLLGVTLPGTWTTSRYAWEQLLDEAHAENARRDQAAADARRRAREERATRIEQAAVAALAATLTRTEHHAQ